MVTYVAYVPVLHEGYRRFFEKHPGPKQLLLFGPEITGRFSTLKKEIRELDPLLMKAAIESLGIFDRVEVLDTARAGALNVPDSALVMPDEDVSREAARALFPEAAVSFDPVFLRWDRHNAVAEKPVVPEGSVTREELHRRMMGQAMAESGKSSDIWRHVGAVIAREGEVLLTGHNAHVPSEHMPYVNGDPRSNFSKGEYIEFSTALHAEAGLIAEAARRGLSLEGADMYVTVFPCPPCAKLVAYSGIRTVYAAGGYSVLDGDELLKSRGVRVLFVED